MQTKENRPTPDEISPQQLEYPASQRDMTPQPDSDLSNYKPANKLIEQVGFITGGDSGIGRAVAIAFWKNHTLIYQGQDCLVIKGDVRNYEDCNYACQESR